LGGPRKWKSETSPDRLEKEGGIGGGGIGGGRWAEVAVWEGYQEKILLELPKNWFDGGGGDGPAVRSRGHGPTSL